MSPVSRLLYRLGYVKLREYGYILTSDGRIVAASAPPDQLLETSDWQLPPDLGAPTRQLRPVQAQAAAPTPVPVRQPPPVFAPPVAVDLHQPAAEAIALDTGAVEPAAPAEAIAPTAAAAAPTTDDADADVDADEEEWEWRVAMARAQERAAEEPSQEHAILVSAPQPRPVTTPPREVAAAFAGLMAAPADDTLDEPVAAAPDDADADADDERTWAAARARAEAQEVTRSTVVRAAPTRPAERPLPRLPTRLTRQSVLPPREKRPTEARAARGTGSDYTTAAGPGPQRSAFDADDTSVETQIESKPYALSGR